MRKLTLAAACLIAASFLLPSPAVAQSNAYREIVKLHAPALVTLKFVLKFGESENESEAAAIFISEDGLLLCANSQLTGMQAYMRGLGASFTPTGIRVLIGDDTEGVDATLIARDSDLDLTWVRIKEPGERKFEFVRLEDATTVEVGDRLLYLSRMGRFFDRSPMVRETRVGGTTRKPRNLLVPSLPVGGPGFPVFAEDGKFVGFSVVQLPSPEEMESGSMNYMEAAGVVLPAADVARATKRALESAPKPEAAGDATEEKPGAAPGDGD